VDARAAAGSVRTARALFGGPLTGTAQALTEGTISAVHASVVAHGTCDLPDHRCAEAEPILVEAACRLDPPRLRRVLGHLRLVADPDGEHDRTQQRHARRGLWLAPTFEGMVAVDGLLEPEAGQSLLAALKPLARRDRCAPPTATHEDLEPDTSNPIPGRDEAHQRMATASGHAWLGDSAQARGAAGRSEKGRLHAL
jgi:hypothetical protein